jgi:hypothetical protein
MEEGILQRVLLAGLIFLSDGSVLVYLLAQDILSLRILQLARYRWSRALVLFH